MLGLCLRINLLFGLNLSLLDYCCGDLFFKSMTLLFWYTVSIMAIRTCIFGTWIFFQSIKLALVHRKQKQSLVLNDSAVLCHVPHGQASFETARDTIKHELHSQSPAQFPYGTKSTNVSALDQQFLPLRILWPSQVLNVMSP
jgi:hypothetical protein